MKLMLGTALVGCGVVVAAPHTAVQSMDVAGFSVDNGNRNDVVSFWHAVYQASEGYEKRVGWTGNYSGKSGTVSKEFTADVERRLNYFRAMCGLNAYARVNTGSRVVIESTDPYKPSSSITKAAAAQEAAMLLIRNYDSKTGNDPALTHFPQPGLTGWSPAAWNALAKGNLAFGLYGPGALTEYMLEKISSGSVTSAWNSEVGHRRWCLYPRATDFASGDQPGTSAYQPPSNIFYVIPNPSELDKNTSTGFVAFPPAGYFPAALNTPYWSLSRENADFSSARVTMTDSHGTSLPVTLVKTIGNFGDPAIIWKVNDATAISSVIDDSRFNVVVSGILGLGIPTSLSYSVTLINPDRITSPQTLRGARKIPAKGSASYSFTPPPMAQALAVVASIPTPATWIEDGEVAKKTQVIDHTGSNYKLIASGSALSGFYPLSGTSSFRLTFPTTYDPILRGVPEQSFELAREITARSNATLDFKFRRGYMTRGSSLVIERSLDGGVSWDAVGNPISGVSDTRYDDKVSQAHVKLPRSSKPFRIRFRYFTRGGIIYTQEDAPKSPTGIYLDDISLTGCDCLVEKKTFPVSPDSGSFSLNTKRLGKKLVKGDKFVLALRTKIGGKWFPNGPLKKLVVSE